MESDSEFSDFEFIEHPSESEDTAPSSSPSASSSPSHSPTLPPQSEDESSILMPNELRYGHPPWQGHRDKLVGLVDMGSRRGDHDGSNGIRFSISDLSAPLARIIPTVFVYRSSISLYDAQYDDKTGDHIPIPDHVITAVCNALRRFMVICADFGVASDQIHVVATEAARVAQNSVQLLSAIKDATGLEVELLEKEQEGQVGALGIASGFLTMGGLVMDLGGGSTQITWIISKNGTIRTSSQGSFSFPYGAAALTRRLQEIRRGKGKQEAKLAVDEFREEMVRNFREAYEKLEIPETLVEEARREGGFRIYLSGGGFRGWGYLLLYLNQTHGREYPISIINGYTVGREQFQDTEAVKQVAKAAHEIFRVSDRRRSQVPAVAFLVNVLAEAIPLGIKEAHFCQGGVREGYLFRQLSSSVRKQAPLEVASRSFAPGSRKHIQDHIRSSIPKASKDGTRRFPPDFGEHVIDAFANVMYAHMFMSKETASTAALYSTSTGIMSSTHGVSHQDRARLALMLQARYRGELPPREVEFRESLKSIISPEDAWWAQYLGRIGYLLTCLYPTGKIHASKPKVLLSADWSWSLGKKQNKEGLILTVSLEKVADDPSRFRKVIDDNIKKVRKAGKKKNWVGDKNPWGMKVETKVTEEGIFSGPDSK
ncbi:unnamed protein product [Clonostachys byssicola]|uniref:Retrograde regulation protein 2 n=1 Tax=Clonostachys byssicola TaxID=160290 RepID=A0A9N9UB08_9HYPO|nr:unnamed protein product [Clonostachys byssicola]